jgi:hypothetical protein
VRAHHVFARLLSHRIPKFQLWLRRPPVLQNDSARLCRTVATADDIDRMIALLEQKVLLSEEFQQIPSCSRQGVKAARGNYSISPEFARLR